jgi:starvation-inducible outer membrane lipoprotein
MGAMRQSLLPGLAAALIGGLAACEDSGQVSDLSYERVRHAAATGDQASFRSFFKDIRGQRVAWDGRVVEVAMEHADEAVEINMLVVDLDSAIGGTTDGDVRFAISAALAENMYPGREVKFTGRIEDYEWAAAEQPVLRLDAQRVE